MAEAARGRARRGAVSWRHRPRPNGPNAPLSRLATLEEIVVVTSRRQRGGFGELLGVLRVGGKEAWHVSCAHHQGVCQA